MSMVDRVFLLFHLRYRMETSILLLKCFWIIRNSIQFIFDTINLRLRSLLKCTLKQIDKPNNYETEDKIISWFTVSFSLDKFMINL